MPNQQQKKFRNTIRDNFLNAGNKGMVTAVMAHFRTIPAFTCDNKEAHNQHMNSAEISHRITWEYKSNTPTCFVIYGEMCKAGLF